MQGIELRAGSSLRRWGADHPEPNQAKAKTRDSQTKDDIMDNDVQLVKVEGLPMTQNECLKVELVPMPSGDNPWRTQGDYRREQKRDTTRFWIAIAASVVSIIGVLATASVAIVTIRNAVQ